MYARDADVEPMWSRCTADAQLPMRRSTGIQLKQSSCRALQLKFVGDCGCHADLPVSRVGRENRDVFRDDARHRQQLT